jgi:hypothetical protein
MIIPDSVTSIGERAFYGCSGLISVAIPDSVIQMDESSFLGCDHLEQVIAPARFHHLFVGVVASLTEPTQYLMK